MGQNYRFGCLDFFIEIISLPQLLAHFANLLAQEAVAVSGKCSTFAALLQRRGFLKYVFDRQFGRLFERAGMDVRELLMGAHLPEDLFGRRDVMLSKEEYYRLMATAGRMAPDGAALRIATEEGIETFSPPIFAAYCSSNAEGFIARFAHYKRLVGPLRYLVSRRDGQVEIEIRGVEDDDRIADFWAEIEMAFIVCLIRKATRVEVKPVSVTMRHRCEDRALLEFLGCEVAEGERATTSRSCWDMRTPPLSSGRLMSGQGKPSPNTRTIIYEKFMVIYGHYMLKKNTNDHECPRIIHELYFM